MPTKKPVRGKTRHRLQLPAPAEISTLRYTIGKFFGSVEYWPRIALAGAVVLAVSRAPNADMSKIVETVGKVLEETAVVAWVVAACLLLFSIITILFIIWWYNAELVRVARQRDELQEKLMERKVQRSSLPSK